ncbi:hypothetical protein Btru_050125 [Bulinus truncatus]|nr:hypothetical protein Btru_050125 [Bulinus truncatus]
MIRSELLVLLLLTGSWTAHSLRCYQCSFVNSPSACSHLVTCSQDEQCFTERRYDGAMREYFTMGCVSASFCQNIDNDLIIGKKRNYVSVSERYTRDPGCLQCCLTEDCNKDLCVKQDTSSREVRLINGNNSYQGTEEVFYNDRWGTVCDDGWDTNAAKVTCKWLGLNSELAIAVTANGFQSNRINGFLLDDLACSGNESRLTECAHAQWGVHNCNAGEQAGVICPSALFPNHDVLYLLEKRLHKLIRMDLQLQTYSFIHTNSTYSPDCFDYDADNDEFYFYDDRQKRILRMKSDGNDLRLVLQLDYITLHLQSLYTYSHYTPTVTLHLQSLYTYSRFKPTVTLHLQSLYSYSHFTPTVTLHLQSLYTYSHFTPTVTLLLQPLYTYSHFTPTVTLLVQSLLLLQSLYSYSHFTPTVTLLLQSLYTFSRFTPTVTLLLQPLYSYSHFTPTVTLLLQSLYTYSHFTPTVTLLLQSLTPTVALHLQPLYSYSHFTPTVTLLLQSLTPTVTLHLQSLYTYSHFTPRVTLLLQSLYSCSHFTPIVTLLLQSLYSYSHYNLQSLYSYSHFTPTVTITYSHYNLQSLYSYSHFTPTVTITYSHFTPTVIIHLQSL